MTTPLVFDDRDPSIIYTNCPGPWSRAGSDSEYQSTTTYSRQKGATAKLTFSGTSVSVWGTVDKLGGPVVAEYTIDGNLNSSETRTEVPKSGIIQYQKLFFQSQALTAGSHTLVITLSSDGSGGDFYLDYIWVTPIVTTLTSVIATTSTSDTATTSTSDIATTSTSVIATTTSTSVNVTTSTSVILTTSTSINVTTSTYVTSTPLPSSAPTISPTPSATTVPVGSIIGAVLGGLAFLICVFIAFMYFRRKRKFGRLNSEESNNVDSGD